MDRDEITRALAERFREDDTRILFWNDPAGEFANLLPTLALDGVTVVRLDEVGALETKIRIERDDPTGRYLLYAPCEEPEFDDDWLLDIRLYSTSFRADRASILLKELGLAHQRLRDHLARRRKFFDNKERLAKLKRLAAPDDDEAALDLKMMAVVTGADQPELFDIVRALFHSLATVDEGGLDLGLPAPAWEEVEKFDLDGPFWERVRATFGYGEESPSLDNLLIRLLVADFAHHLGCEVPAALQGLLLPRSGAANAVVCLDHWRDSSRKAASYNRLAEGVAARLGIDDLLHGLPVEALLDVMTFRQVEGAIVRGLLERVRAGDEAVDAEEIRAVVARRQDGHWVSSLSVDEAPRRARHAVYEAIAVAADLFTLRSEIRGGFEFDSAAGLYRAYEEELYRFDQLYRHFCENGDRAESQGWDLLKPLREEVEASYCNDYLTRLGLAWGRFVASGLLEGWTIEGVPNQYRFFEERVAPRLRGGKRRRLFVIISDALRYEVAEELVRVLNRQYRLQAELASQLGVLPSYTALGMASLLPHTRLEYTPKGEVLVDGRATASLDQRNEVLAGVGGTAIRADALLAMKKEEGRALVADKEVVYVYHDEIDSRGDHAATEGDTFEAARKAIDELANLVRYIVNNLNGNNVVVTADHGFLFTETPPGETDKSRLEERPAGTVKAKKRYLLGHHLPDHDDAWRGETAVTAQAAGDMEFWIPKGTNRFHFSGGARFVHGGAMLQEIVVPVVTVKHRKDRRSREGTQVRPVTVQVLGTSHKITTQKHRFRLVQMEPVGERLKPITLKVAVYEDGEPVTSIETVTFDSTSGNLDERQKSLFLTLRDRPYDKQSKYSLILRDADSGIEHQRVDVVIDRAISDDFDF